MIKLEYFEKNKLNINSFVETTKTFDCENNLYITLTHKKDEDTTITIMGNEVKCAFCNQPKQELLSLRESFTSGCCWNSTLNYYGDNLICKECFIERGK